MAMGVGDDLIEAGWRQGSVFRPGPTRMPYVKKEDERWVVAERELGENDWFVVSSQSCDVERDIDREPFVEVLRAYETDDKNVVHQARRGSTRYHLLRQREGGTALVACAVHRITLEKVSLLGLSPEFTVRGDAAERFRRFLARRQARPALEKRVVEGIQRPIVDAVKRCMRDERMGAVLDGIREFVFYEHAPGDVEVLLIREDDASFTTAEVGEVMGRVVKAVKERGIVSSVTVDVVSLDQLTARDYQAFVPLPLDDFSETEAEQATAPVRRREREHRPV